MAHTRSGRAILTVGIAFIVLAIAAGVSLAHEFYDDTGSCLSCHGDFREWPYTSLKPGEGDWPTDLHDTHRDTMLGGSNGICDACHGGLGGSRSPVSLYTSDGVAGSGWPAVGCLGCHGRDDGTGTITGVGLRQHHYVTGTTGCVDCHTDSNPANVTPVGEDVLPPYYNNPSYPTPDDPCNPSPDYSEGSFAASTLGLDNDGDNVYDENDSDCGAVTAPPGETSGSTLNPLLVTAHNLTAGNMMLGFESGCVATENTIYYGPLASISSYGYSGQQCVIGTSGSYNWTYPAGDLFFVIVGNDGVAEGSYGVDSGLNERPEDAALTTCPVPQVLTDRCDGP
jgi:hypothetical protein